MYSYVFYLNSLFKLLTGILHNPNDWCGNPISISFIVSFQKIIFVLSRRSRNFWNLNFPPYFDCTELWLCCYYIKYILPILKTNNLCRPQSEYFFCYFFQIRNPHLSVHQLIRRLSKLEIIEKFLAHQSVIVMEMKKVHQKN